MQARLQELAQRALFDRTIGPTAFPNVPVTYLIAGRSVWHCIWASYMSKKMYENSLGQGKAVRPMRFIVMDEANHFVSQKDSSLSFRWTN
jgi:hypothetical protein